MQVHEIGAGHVKTGLGDSLSHSEWGRRPLLSTSGRNRARSYSRFSCGYPHVMAGGYRPPTSLREGRPVRPGCPALGPGMTGEGRSRGPQRFPNTWVQMAIIPINKASEARAAASWITALNITSSPGTE